MSSLNMDLGVLEHQMHQAHRNAVQAELSAAGLQEVGHPFCCASCAARGSAARTAGPEGAGGAAEHFAARSGSIPEIPGEKGVYSPEPEPGDARRNRVRLTAKGEKAVDDCFACLQR